MHPVATLFLCIASAIGPGASEATEVRASAWFNSPSIRIPDDRTYVLFFFTTFQKKDVAPFINRLNRLDKRRDTVVVGLTPESKERVKSFIEKRKIRFAVGSGSRAYKDFRIKRFPRVVVLDHKASSSRIVETFADLESFERWGPELPDDQTLDSGAFTETSAVELLKRHASKDPDHLEQRRAVKILRGKLPAADFMLLCDELLAKHDPADRMYGHVAYQRHLADPDAVVKEPLLAGSTLARREEREKSDDPRWVPLHDYFATVDDLAAEQLFQDFFDRLADDPVNLQIRTEIPRRLEHIAHDYPEQKTAIVEHLMAMLPVETNFANRSRIVGALLGICEPGDLEVAEFLEDRVAQETDIRVVQPMMEYTIRYLRTGEE